MATLLLTVALACLGPQEPTELPVVLRAPDGRPFDEVLAEHVPHLPSTGKLYSLFVTTEPAERALSAPDHQNFVSGRSSFRGVDHLLVRRRVLPEGAVGVLDVPATRPLHAHLSFGDVLLSSAVVEEGAAWIDIVADPATLANACAEVRVRVVDAAGDAIRPTDLVLSAGTRLLQDTGVEERLDGEIRFAGVAPGWRVLVLRGEDVATRLIEVRVRAGEELDLGTVTLGTPVPISGHVLDDRGQGVAVDLRAMPWDGRMLPTLSSGSAGYERVASDLEGRFSFASLAPGRWVLTARSLEHAAVPVLVDTRGGAAASRVSLRLEEGVPVELRSTFGDFEACRVQIREAGSGVPVGAWRFVGRDARKLRLRPGRYLVEVFEEGELLHTRQHELGEEPEAWLARSAPE